MDVKLLPKAAFRALRLVFKPGSFECQKCGACCSKYTVCVTDADVKRIINFYGFSPHSFLEGVHVPSSVAHTYRGIPRFIGDRGKELVLALKEKSGRCIFNRGECEVYPVRPMNCRAFPFLWLGGRRFKLNPDALLICDGVGRGKKFEFDKLVEDMLLLEKEWESYRSIVEEWNDLVRSGSLAPSTRKFIDFILGSDKR
ncbi:MAG: YkgJ family cysteine cluster protein [Thermosphaera sp.]